MPSAGDLNGKFSNKMASPLRRRQKGHVMADPNGSKRPLSPHIFIWRWQIYGYTSGLTRITGVAMFVSALLIVWWLFAASTSPGYFAMVDWLLTSWLGDLIMVASVWSLWFHMLAGIRHLIFDQARWMDMATADKLSWVLLIGATLLTLITIVVMLMGA